MSGTLNVEKPSTQQIVEQELLEKKKSRLTWTESMHSLFVEAVNNLGYEKAVPKKILEGMNIEGLTRENVASHLQKYRQNKLKQQQNVDIKTPNHDCDQSLSQKTNKLPGNFNPTTPSKSQVTSKGKGMTDESNHVSSNLNNKSSANNKTSSLIKTAKSDRTLSRVSTYEKFGSRQDLVKAQQQAISQQQVLQQQSLSQQQRNQYQQQVNYHTNLQLAAKQKSENQMKIPIPGMRNVHSASNLANSNLIQFAPQFISQEQMLLQQQQQQQIREIHQFYNQGKKNLANIRGTPMSLTQAAKTSNQDLLAGKKGQASNSQSDLGGKRSFDQLETSATNTTIPMQPSKIHAPLHTPLSDNTDSPPEYLAGTGANQPFQNQGLSIYKQEPLNMQPSQALSGFDLPARLNSGDMCQDMDLNHQSGMMGLDMGMNQDPNSLDGLCLKYDCFD